MGNIWANFNDFSAILVNFNGILGNFLEFYGILMDFHGNLGKNRSKFGHFFRKTGKNQIACQGITWTVIFDFLSFAHVNIYF